MSNKVIYFDLFNTLVKSDRGYLEQYFDSELDKLGDLGILKDEEMTINEIVKRNPELLENHSIDEMCKYYDLCMKQSFVNIDEDILSMLGSLKEMGYKLCIISDAAYVDIKGYENSLLANYFDDVVFSCEHGVVKPNKEIYEIALAKMGNPIESFFVGDGGHDELVGAKAVGMKTIKVEWFKKYDLYDCVDYVINIPSYLVNIFKNKSDDIFISVNSDKEPYVKKITNDKIINLTGESGSGKSYFSKQWQDDEKYIIIDTDIVFSDEDSENKESVEVRKLFVGKNKDYIITNFDDFYLTILDYFKDVDKYVVIDSAQFRNIKDVSILKGEVIVMRTCINTCYERCINRWKSRNDNFEIDELEKFKQRKLGMFEWYKSINTFLLNVDNL